MLNVNNTIITNSKNVISTSVHNPPSPKNGSGGQAGAAGYLSAETVLMVSCELVEQSNHQV